MERQLSETREGCKIDSAWVLTASNGEYDISVTSLLKSIFELNYLERRIPQEQFKLTEPIITWFVMVY